jgi:hypothetical protein
MKASKTTEGIKTGQKTVAWEQFIGDLFTG